jgi:bifunctional non-homologous end joining protein LigD
MLMRSPVARDRRSPPGFVLPCQPRLADHVPRGPGWIFELKHDGIGIIARKEGATVRIWSGNGRSRTADFLAIVESLRLLSLDHLVLDGEAVAHCSAGLPDFNRTLTADGQRQACLYAFDLLMLAGEDPRPLPLLDRRKRLQRLLKTAPTALVFSEHLEADGEAIFRHACAMGLEGIVAKRADRPYRSGRVLALAQGQELGKAPTSIGIHTGKPVFLGELH